MENQTTLKWYQKPVTIILFLFLFFPVGLYLMWKNELWSKTARIAVSMFFGLVVVGNINKGNKNNSSYENSNTTTQNPCEDMDSYNKGVSYGRLERGGLPDCDTYYYEGAAANKDCWCKGFMEGRK